MVAATRDSRNRSVNASDSGNYTGDGTAAVITLGYNPVFVYVVNETDATTWTKMKGMAAANSVKTVTAGTTTVDTTSAILFNGDGTITLSAALGASGKHIVWYAER